MKFVDSNLENVLTYLNRLTPETKPLLGKMTAQQVVEHLTLTLEMAMGKRHFDLQVKPEQFETLRKFIGSDKPLPRDFKAVFAPENPKLVHEELALAIDDYCDKWMELEDFFESHPGIETEHPHFGPLNYELWIKIHEKHLTHHFTQFGLIND